MNKYIRLKKALAHTSRTVFFTLLIVTLSAICIQNSVRADSSDTPRFPHTLHAMTRGSGSGSSAKNINLVIDPGHGGDQSGAENSEVKEKHINLKTAEYLKEELESAYDDINISFTRDGDYDVDLKERVQIAADRDADMLISLHNNARGEKFAYKDGCTVLTAQGNYKPELAQQEQELACCILSELTALGLNDRGILLRDSEIGDTYEDGSIADYYAIIRAGINLDVPSVIVEHAFIDEESDYENHLSSDEKLRELALADARGIAKYFRLPSKEDGEVLPLPENYEMTFYHMYDDNPDHNKISTEIFYPSDDRPAASEEDNTKEEASKSSEDDKDKASQESDHSASDKKSNDQEDPNDVSSDKKGKDQTSSQDKSSDDKDNGGKNNDGKTFIDYFIDLIRLMTGGK